MTLAQFRILSMSACTKTADLLVSPKTVLAWIVTASGAPAWVLPMLVPIKESGSLLPQWLFQRSTANRLPDKVLAWRLGAAIQGAGILCLPFTLYYLEGNTLGLSVLLLLSIISSGRALCSLTFKVIQADTVNKGKRGRLIGLASSISGALTALACLYLLLMQQQPEPGLLRFLIGIAGVLFFIALMLTLRMPAVKDATDKQSRKSSHTGLLGQIRQHAALRHLIINRLLSAHAGLIIPFLIALAFHRQNQSMIYLFMLLAAISSLLSSYVWGKLSDRSALATLRIAISTTLVAATLMALPFMRDLDVTLYLCFFLFSMGHAGIRNARKTYILDLTENANRGDYVAVANTSVGIGLLILGTLYAAVSGWMESLVAPVMAVALLLGWLHTFYMPAEK